MIDIPWHENSINAGKIIEWNGSDQQNLFEKNLSDPITNSILKINGWDVLGCIQYKFNSHGFRDQQFDSRPCGIAFGCSFTQGVGVPESCTWPSVLSKHLGIHVWNLGIGGCALDTIFRISEYYIDLLNPEFITLFCPPPWRLEYAKKNGIFEVLLPNTLQAENAGDFIQNWFSYDINNHLNQKKNLLALTYICQQKNIPLHVLDTQQCGNDRLARDLLHPGRDHYYKISRLFENMICV